MRGCLHRRCSLAVPAHLHGHASYGLNYFQCNALCKVAAWLHWISGLALDLPR